MAPCIIEGGHKTTLNLEKKNYALKKMKFQINMGCCLVDCLEKKLDHPKKNPKHPK